MFGYIRPHKSELLMREFTRYKSVYCGICKTIKKNYGNINRLALTYDMTFFALLYLSLSEQDAVIMTESCFLNPIKKKPILYNHIALEKAASLSMIFAYNKINDDINDERNIFLKTVYKFGKILFNTANIKSLSKLDFQNNEMLLTLKELYTEEKNSFKDIPNYEITSKLFGEVLRNAFKIAFKDIIIYKEIEKNKLILEGLEFIGIYLGRWIYLIDAIEDYDEDIKKGDFNPFFPMSKEKAKSIAENLLVEYEEKLDLTAALLPYNRDGSIIYNIIKLGLPKVREQILRGETLTKL